MSRIWQTGAGIIVYAKGAPESIIARCALSEAERVNALASAEKLAARGLRVLAFAKRPVDAPPVDAAEAENNLELVGLAAFE
ncbi:MAG: hypothetical protein C4305_07240, partial [Thermoleophilia bacterium]